MLLRKVSDIHDNLFIILMLGLKAKTVLYLIKLYRLYKTFLFGYINSHI